MGNGRFEVGFDDRCVFADEDVVINNAIMRTLGRVVDGIPDLEQWQFKIEDQKGDELSPHYSLSFTSTAGRGNSCAHQKMNTLRNHPEIINTRDVKEFGVGSGEVCWYGGINLKYIGYEDASITPTEGIVRIVFSGAREAIDLMIVITILQAYIKACDDFLPRASYIYDIDSLRKDQLSNYFARIIFPT